MTERELQHHVLVAVGSLPGVRVFRMNIGRARAPGGRVVTFGTPGMGDLLVLVGARYGWLEIKGPSGRQTPAQRAFETTVRQLGGLYVVVRRPEDALRAVEALRGGPACRSIYHATDALCPACAGPPPGRRR